jgi:hypothetical protein
VDRLPGRKSLKILAELEQQSKNVKDHIMKTSHEKLYHVCMARLKKAKLLGEKKELIKAPRPEYRLKFDYYMLQLSLNWLKKAVGSDRSLDARIMESSEQLLKEVKVVAMNRKEPAYIKIVEFEEIRWAIEKWKLRIADGRTEHADLKQAAAGLQSRLENLLATSSPSFLDKNRDLVQKSLDDLKK